MVLVFVLVDILFYSIFPPHFMFVFRQCKRLAYVMKLATNLFSIPLKSILINFAISYDMHFVWQGWLTTEREKKVHCKSNNHISIQWHECSIQQQPQPHQFVWNIYGMLRIEICMLYLRLDALYIHEYCIFNIHMINFSNCIAIVVALVTKLFNIFYSFKQSVHALFAAAPLENWLYFPNGIQNHV